VSRRRLGSPSEQLAAGGQIEGEIRDPKETRNPKPEYVSHRSWSVRRLGVVAAGRTERGFGPRISDFLRVSDLGFLISPISRLRPTNAERPALRNKAPNQE